MTFTSKIERDFLEAAKVLEADFSVSLQLMHRAGKRLEYAAGKVICDEQTALESHLLEAGESWVVRVYPWEKLSKETQTHISQAIQILAIRNHEWTREELVKALEGSQDHALTQQADLLRAEVCGDEVHRRGLIEFSNYCGRDCHYCGLRKENKKIPRYRMTPEEIIDCAKNAKALGYGSVVLQSGEDGAFKIETLCEIVRAIKQETQLAITLSLGEKSFEDYKKLKESGADRYLLRFETSNAELFQKLRPGTTLAHRLECLEWLRELKYQVGSGCMVGIPGQTLQDLADDLLLMKKLDLDMVGVGPFIPHPETPLKDTEQGNLELVLRFVALVRLVTQNTHIPATTALGSIHPFGRERALQGGANVIMPNVTPQKYRKFYEIYPNKICITEKPSDCAGCVGSMVHSLGRKLGQGAGHSYKIK